MLSPAETKDLYPLMNVDDLYGTLYVPKDGTMDPAGTCTTLSRAATARGAKVNCSDALTSSFLVGPWKCFSNQHTNKSVSQVSSCCVFVCVCVCDKTQYNVKIASLSEQENISKVDVSLTCAQLIINCCFKETDCISSWTCMFMMVPVCCYYLEQ